MDVFIAFFLFMAWCHTVEAVKEVLVARRDLDLAEDDADCLPGECKVSGPRRGL